MKKVLMVSNSWRPSEEEQICLKCGSSIEYSWGDYSFRYFEKKDKSDLGILCKSCAVELKNTDKQVKVINRSYIMDLISMKNSGWKPQPKQKARWGSGGSDSGGGAAGEINPDNKEDADK
ncbi:MAG: hypothetical protein JEZ04_04355 [Spirochaetales bacterium]|nr:hypothetical protein [Spirochaetales bacterium]